MRDKKGVSTIVVTVILVALVLIAVGIVWAVVSNLINRSAGTVKIQEKCLGITVQPTGASCTTGTCDVTVERTGINTDAIGGVKLVFKNNTANSGVLDQNGDVPSLVPTTYSSVATGLGGGVNRVEATVYVYDDSGTEQLCAQTSVYNF